MSLLKLREVDYQGLAELVSAYERPYGSSSENREWFGGDSREELASKMAHGEPDVAAKAESMFSEVLDALMPQTDDGYRNQRCSSPVGSFPNVGAFLAGRPDSMFGTEAQDELGPVSLYIDLGCQAHVERESMLARGLAISALAYALQTIRPVELYLVHLSADDYGEHLATKCRLGVSPFDLTQVATAVSHIGIGRRLLTDPEQSGVKTLYGNFASMSATEVFGLGPGDVYFPVCRSYEEEGWRDNPIESLRETCGDQLDSLQVCSERGGGAQ